MAKFVPEIVTDVPTVAFAGIKPVIVGTCANKTFPCKSKTNKLKKTKLFLQTIFFICVGKCKFIYKVIYLIVSIWKKQSNTGMYRLF